MSAAISNAIEAVSALAAMSFVRKRQVGELQPFHGAVDVLAPDR